MMTHSLLAEAIELLDEALTNGLYEASAESVLQYRRSQLKRRTENTHIFVAFIGEKKAGKTALVRALTQVPLPMAVRECTAAVCEIQVGSTLHHQAAFSDGQEQVFEPLDDTQQKATLTEQNEKDLEAAQKAALQIRIAERKAHSTKEELLEITQHIEALEDQLDEEQQALLNARGSQPWMLPWLKPFTWASTALSQRFQTIETLTRSIQKQVQEHEQHRLLHQRTVDQLTTEKAAVSTNWEVAKALAAKHSQAVLEAQDAVESVHLENESRFEADLSNFIDVSKNPAEHVKIQSPNADIPPNIILLDTPGLNTDRADHRRRAWAAIEELSDVCILVSDLRQPMPDTVMDMLDRLIPYCPNLHVALTKRDLAISDATFLSDDPLEEVAEAISVAKSRIMTCWPHPLTVWPIASIHPDDQMDAREKFRSFWDSLGPELRIKKDALLAATVLAEVADLLVPQLQALQQQLQQLQTQKLQIEAESIVSFEAQHEVCQQKITLLLRRLRLDIRTHIHEPKSKWVEQLNEAKTKGQVESKLESMRTELRTHTESIEDWLRTELKSGIQNIAQSLWDGEQPLSDAQVNRLHGVICAAKEQEEDNAWLWTAGSAAAGAAIGLLLTGGLALPLLLAAGSGGLANLLVAPLADTKRNAIEELSEGFERLESIFLAQLDGLSEELEEQIKLLLLSATRAELDTRFSERREQFLAEQDNIKSFQHRLWQSRTRFLQRTQEQRNAEALEQPQPEASVKEQTATAVSDQDASTT